MKSRVSWHMEIQKVNGTLKRKSIAKDCDEIYVTDKTMLAFYDGHKTEKVDLSDVKHITFFPKEARQLSYSRTVCKRS